MAGTRWALGRMLALGVLLALSVLLLGASKADAGKYAVAQCGWYVGADAGWADTTGGAKFRPDAYCVPPPGADPFAGAHLKSFTRDGQGTVSGTRFAGWRWSAASGTKIMAVRGHWWHALHDGMEQRLGAVNWGGGFEPFLQASTTDTTPREFSRGFPIGAAAFEDRLLCARAETKWCSLERGSWSGLRALTLTIEDPAAPIRVGFFGGDLVAGGWRRGLQGAAATASDEGAGIRFGETLLDGARVGLTEYPCEKALVGGEWRATRMRPCLTTVSTTHNVSTNAFSDGPHTLVHCATDFAANSSCGQPRTVLIDNNPPAHPRAVALAGGEGWRRSNDFDLSWENPDQGPASPIAGVSWRIAGSAGFDTGARFAAGRDRRSLANLTVPAAGSYALQLWLRDEAGNEAPSSAVTVPLRLDDVRPAVGFSAEASETHVKADVTDPHSGPASGQILYRRVDADEWTELPTKLARGNAPDRAHLVAPMPQLGYGTFVFRVDAADAAGNTVSTTLRTDGTQMAVRRVPPPHVPRSPVSKPPRTKARLFARLHGGRGRGDALTVRFGAPALLSGRLVRADGAGAGGRELRVVSRPSQGALTPRTVRTVRTGERGGFELQLPPGPSRRLTVSFPGDGGLEPASRRPLELRVRAGISLRAVPQSLRTGQAVRLSGEVRGKGAPIPRRGKLVAIQYLEEATRRWRPVLVTRSDHHGRFRARYRFRYVTGQAAIRLRATALAEERWPYVPGSSPPVTVRVRG
ncbi:MAG: carboxypeptidase-like regulatory domain-containing protein [Actinomycetota bacterium]|nr:carboxypeptidase-like regulatory domain-containing protein [Actinomycetota bacterium]